MKDIAEFIAHNYYKDESHQGIERIRAMLAHPGVFFEGSIDGGLILVYITLSDEGMEILRSAKTVEDFKNGFSDRLLNYPGTHIYVFRMVTEGKPTLQQLRYLRGRILSKHNATSFSWHDNNHVILHTYEA